MEPFEYIQILSTLIWSIVPFRMIKSKHFIFFLLMGFNDFSSFFLWHLFSISSQTFWVPVSYLIVFSISKDFFIKKIRLVLLGFFIILIANFYSSADIQNVILLLFDVVVLIIFTRYLFWEYIISDKISLFYTVMTIYCLLTVFKTILMISNMFLGLNSYYVGTILQIVIGLYLIFVRRDVKISLKL